MSTTVTADPVAFRCDKCFNVNCATSLEVGQTIDCRTCSYTMSVPEATSDRIILGYEFLKEHAAEQAMPTGPDMLDENMTDAEIFKAARQEARAGSGPEALVCSRMRRLLAILIDSFAFLFAFGIGAGALMVMCPTPEDITLMPILACFAFPVLLQIVQWTMTAMDGRTIGKYCLNIKVVNLQCQPPGFFQGVVMRYWVMALINTIPFMGLIDAFFIFGNESNRCIHDFIAGTFVIEAN